MTTKTDLLPSSVDAFTEALKGESGSLDAWLEVNDESEVAAHIEAYASDCVSRATAEKDAEIERLRAEVERVTCELMDATTRADKLEEAIKAYKSECDNPAKDYVLRAKRRDEMFALLRDQEEGNGQ